MSSITRAIETRSKFAAAVTEANRIAETAPVAKPSLPDDSLSVLMALKPKTPEEKQELKNFISERFDLNTRTLEFVTRQLTTMHADLEQRHEEAKRAVVEQGGVLENLKTKLAEDTQDFIRKHNLYTKAGTAVWECEQSLKGQSRFASKKEIAEVQERVQLANKRLEEAQERMASTGQARNYLQTVTIPAENKKLAGLIEAEIALDDQLKGYDPVLRQMGVREPEKYRGK